MENVLVEQKPINKIWELSLHLQSQSLQPTGFDFLLILNYYR